MQLAKLACLPDSVVKSARLILKMLEKKDRESRTGALSLFEDLPLFAATPSPIMQTSKNSVVEDILSNVLPDELSPRDALALIYKLKENLKQ